jgi:hypothetical protein
MPGRGCAQRVDVRALVYDDALGQRLLRTHLTQRADPAGRFVLSVGSAPLVRLWNIATGRLGQLSARVTTRYTAR